MLTSISSSSSSSSSKPAAEAEAVKDQTADSISNALRSISIEDLSGQQITENSSQVTEVTEITEDHEDDHEETPCESDDLASRDGSDSETESETKSSSDSNDDGPEEEEMPSEASDASLSPATEMKSEKASKDDHGEDLPPSVGQVSKKSNFQSESGTADAGADETDQNQTSQNGSNMEVSAPSDDIVKNDQPMDAGGFANFSIADLTAIGELERPVLLSEFQTSMYWLNMRLGKGL